MGRGLRKLILGGLKGAVIGQEDARRRENIERERKRRERLAIERIVGENPEAFKPEPVDPPAKAPNLAMDPDPFGVEPPVPPAAPHDPAAGIDEIGALHRVTSYRQRVAAQREARNRAHYNEIHSVLKDGAGLYDPTRDYEKEHTKIQERQRLASAMVSQLGMSQSDADAYVATGVRMDDERRKKEKAEREATAPKAPVVGTPAWEQSQRTAAKIRAEYRPAPRASQASGGESPAATEKRKGTYVRSRIRELMKGSKDDDGMTVPGLKMSDAVKQAKEEWDLTEGAHAALDGDDADFSDVSSGDEPAASSGTAQPAQLRKMYDAAAAQLRKEGASPQKIQATLGERP